MLFKDSQKSYDTHKAILKNGTELDPIRVKARKIALQRCFKENRPVDLFEIYEIEHELKNGPISINEVLDDENYRGAYILGSKYAAGKEKKIISKRFADEMFKRSDIAGRCFREGYKQTKKDLNNKTYLYALLTYIRPHNKRYSKANQINDIYKRKR